MAEYKNSIMLGLKLESKDSIEKKLQSLIKTLNNTKIDLDINIKNSDVAKQLETLTTLANNFKNSLGGNINLGNINEIINQATISMERLNGEVLKTRTVLNQDGTGKRYSEIANGIGIITKQTEVLNQETKQWEITEDGKTSVIVNNEKIKNTIEDITNAQKRLNELQSRGNINNNIVDELKNNLSGVTSNLQNKNDIYNSNEIKAYIEQVKQLEKTEQDNIQLANQIQDAWDKAYQKRISSEQKALEQIQANEKQAYENEIRMLGEQAVAQQKSEQDLINAMANGREKAELKTQKTDRTEELNQAKAISQALEEQSQMLKQQEEAYRQIDVLKSNGIINNNDISKLEKMVQESNSLKDVNNALKSIMSTSMMKESSIVTISKQIDDTQIKLDKMKQTFGSKLPNGFTDSIQLSLNKLKDDLNSANEFSFNGIKNNLNQVNSAMKITTNETQQLVNSLKETNNNSFFGSMSSFLSRIGIFYGIQQVTQEISQQFKSASEYTISMDTHMSNIQMITGRTRDEVSQVSDQFKELASQLHATNEEIMSSAEEMMRAGYSDDDSKKMIESATVGAKISGQTTEQVSQQLIALKNAFNMSSDSMSHVIDIFSKMDNTSATSFKELADAVQRTAFSAQEAGVPLETLTAYITTTSEKTRKAASTIGESYKTIFSRYQNIKLGNLDEDGKTINDTETAMNRIGIAIRNSKGEFKDFNTVLEEFMNKIKEGNISQIDKLAGVQALAGTRQKESLLALIDNMDALKKHEEDMSTATGSAKKMFDDVYGESLQAKINDLKRAFEQLYEKMMGSDSLKWLITEFTQLITALSSVDGTTLKYIGTIGLATLAISRLVEINKTLMAVQAGETVATGFTKLLGVLTGMTPLYTATATVINETTNATKAMQIAQVGLTEAEVAGTVGLTGFSGAWTLLTTAIGGATTSALAFMATPIGMVITAIGIALAVAGAEFYSYQKHQEELAQESKDLKTALEGVDSALKGGDTKTAQDNLDKLTQSEKKYQDLLDDKKTLQEKINQVQDDIGSHPSNFETDSALLNQYNSELQNTNSKLDDQKTAFKNAGLTIDETTGKIKELGDEAKKVDYAKAVEQAKIDYDTLGKSITTAKQYLDQLNQSQELTPQLIQEMTNAYGSDTVDNIKNISDAQEFLNNKISEQSEKQAEAYELMINDDNNFYQQKLENNDNFKQAYEDLLGAFQTDGENAYNVDFENYKTLNELKQGTQNDLGVAIENWLVSVVGESAKNYQIDFSNFKSFAEAKASILQQLSQEIGYVTSQLAEAQDAERQLANQDFSDPNKMTQEEASARSDANDLDGGVSAIQNKLNNLQTAYGKINTSFNNFEGAVQGASVGGIGGLGSSVGGDYMPSGGGSGSKGKSGGSGKSQEEKDAEKAQKEADEWKKKIDDLNSDTIKPDPYYEVNNTITQLDNSMKALKTSEDGLTGNDLVQAKQKEIEVMNKQIDAQKSLQALQEIERDNLKSTLSQYGILTDETGNLTNAQEKLNQMQADANSLVGSSEVEYEVKKKAIDQVKQLSEEVSKYNDIVNKSIPETIDKWNELSNSIKKANEEAKKASEDTVNATGEKLVEALKQEYEKKKTEELKELKDEYEDDVKDLQDDIDSLQKKLDSLNDESTDNQTKLAKLKAERQLWLNETNNVFAKSKVTSLDSQISDLEKTIQKDSLQKQIDDLNKEKSAREDTYNKQVQDTEDLYSDLEDEHKLYNKATELLTTKNTKRIKELLSSQDESFKEIGTKLGQSLNDPIQQEVNDTITAIDNLIDKINELNDAKEEKSSKSSSKSSSSKSSSSEKTVSGVNSSGKSYTETSGKYSNGTNYTIVKYDTGGRTPSNIGSEGKLGILDADEKILNAKDTVMIDEMYDYIKSSGALLSQLSATTYSNIGNYNIPSLSTDLNTITNNAINNTNTDNSNYSPIQMAVSIVNHNGTDAIMNEKSLEKMVNKVVQKSAKKYGGKGFSNR